MIDKERGDTPLHHFFEISKFYPCPHFLSRYQQRRESAIISPSTRIKKKYCRPLDLLDFVEENSEEEEDPEKLWPYLRVSEFLIENGADCLAFNWKARSPFSLACKYLMSELVSTMVLKGKF